MTKKKYYFGKNKIISAYKFMMMCGLECPKRENVLISHEIMMRKLCLRNQKFPDKVTLPVRMSVKKIDKHDVYEGKTILVKDDYHKILPYYIPIKMFTIESLTPEEIEERREASIKTFFNEEKPEFPNGYIKYLLKKEKKALLMQKENENTRTDFLDEDYVTENRNRLIKVQSRKRRY